LLLGASLPCTDALRRFTCVRVTSRTYDFHQTRPRGEDGVRHRLPVPAARQTCPCLLGVGFPPLGPRFGLPPPVCGSCQSHAARTRV